MRVLALARKLLPLAKVAAFDPAQQVRPELRVDRDSGCPTDNRLLVPHQRPLHDPALKLDIPPDVHNIISLLGRGNAPPRPRKLAFRTRPVSRRLPPSRQ